MAAVTACVPVYEAEPFVEQTLEALRSQTYGDIEVLVSVDRSEDRSLELCGRFAADPRFRIIEQKTRLGFVGNIEYLLGRANGEFVFLMPHDDWIEPRYVDVLVRRLRAAPEAIVCYTDLERFGATGGEMHQPSLVGPRHHRAVAFLRDHNHAVAFRGLMRRDRLPSPALLPRNSHEDFAADTAWLLALACRGEFLRVPEVLYRKRIHQASQFRRWRRRGPEWHVAAWLEHCVTCAALALPHARSEAEASRVLAAARDRLTMPHRDLWPPSGIHVMGEHDRGRLAARFEVMLRAMLDTGEFPRAPDREAEPGRDISPPRPVRISRG